MNTKNQSWIAMLATVLLVLFTGVAAYLLADYQWVWKVSGGLAILSLVAYLYMDRAFYAHSLSKKTTQYGINSVVMSVLAVALAIVVNMITSNYDVKLDVTKNKLHTLSDQSQKVIKGLKSPVTLKAFVAPNQMPEFDAVFAKYAYYNQAMLKKEYIDVDKDRFIVQKFNIKQPGTIIVEGANRTARVDNLGGSDDPKIEEKLTNAIIQVVKGEKKKIYFMSGHGEHLISDTGREGLSQMKESLEEGRYQLEQLVLIEKDKVPADAEIVVISGPKSDFLPQEITMLEAYVKSGGKVLVMLEPTSSPALRPMLAKYGIDWHATKAVLETNRLQQLAGGHPIAPVVTNYNTESDITRDLRQLTIFPIATPVEKLGNVPAGNTVVSLFSTSTRSFEVDLKGDNVTLDERKDRKGPISLALSVVGKVAATPPPPADPKAPKPAAEDKPKDTEYRIVAVGDSDFATNGSRRLGVNADLFQNMLSWLAHEEDLISIRPHGTDTSEFEITEQRARLIFFASVIVLPLLSFFAGVMVWWKRRNA